MRLFWLLLVVAVVVMGVTMAIQYYNYYAFKHELLTDKMDDLLAPVVTIDDEQALIARRLIIEEIQQAGYDAGEDSVQYFAEVPGSVRLLSEHIYQVTSARLKRAELHVKMEFTIRMLVFGKTVRLSYTKPIKG